MTRAGRFRLASGVTGIGGAILALVEREDAQAIGATVVARYRAKTGRRATAHVCTPADGAGEVT